MAKDAATKLYALPREDFTSARKALVEKLRREGRSIEAADALRLVKPTVGAWAINQLVRKEPRLLRAVFDAGDHIRDALDLATPDVKKLRDAMHARSRAVKAAVSRAAREIERAGNNPSRTVVESIETMLRLASTDHRIRRAASSGRLTAVVTSAEVPWLELFPRSRHARGGRTVHTRVAARRPHRRRTR